MMTTDNSAVIARLERQRDELAEALNKAGKWMSAAISDPNTCKECKEAFSDVFTALANLDSACDSQNAKSDTQDRLCGVGERQERAAVPEGWRLVPDDLVEVLKDACRSHQDRGTFLTVHMNDIALLLQRTIDEGPHLTAPQPPAEQPAVLEIHPAVMAFAYAMQYKLDANRHKDGIGWERDANGARNGWSGASIKFLLQKLEEETGELTEVVEEHGGDAIWQEAADVGNIAMMLADNTDALQYASQPPTEQQAVPKGWSVEMRDGMYLVQKHDADGSFEKGVWIDPEQHSYVLCEMLSEMQQGGRE